MCEDSVHELDLALAYRLVLFVRQWPDSVVLVVQHGRCVVGLLDGLVRDNDVQKVAVELIFQSIDSLEVIHYFEEASIFHNVRQVLIHAACELYRVD